MWHIVVIVIVIVAVVAIAGGNVADADDAVSYLGE